MKYLLGIDIGTTNLKANLYDLEGKRISGTSRYIRTHYSKAKGQQWSAYNPDELWGQISTIIREVVGQVTNPRMIAGIGITGMGEPGIPIDGSGEWLYPAITWFDPRAKPQAQWWADHFDLYKLFEITGQPLHPMYSINRIMWFRENEPFLYRRMKKWLNLEDYIIFKLTGNFATDFSIASRTMGFDVRKQCWSKEVFRAAQIDIEIMPSVYPSGTIVGKVSKKASDVSGLAEGTPVVTGGHDHGCAALAGRVFEQGSLLDSTGTSEAILTVLDTPILSNKIYEAGLAVYPHSARGKFQVLGGILFSGRTLDWYIEQFGYKEKMSSQKEANSVYSMLLNKAASVNIGSSGLFWLPHLGGTLADPTSRGALIGITSSHREGHILRAIIEGLCYELRATIESYEELFGLEIDRVVAVGGATESDFWLQTKADITGRTIETPAVVEAASSGAALLAGIGVDVYENYNDATKNYRIKKKSIPLPRHSRKYESYYRNIYTKMRYTLPYFNERIHKEFPVR